MHRYGIFGLVVAGSTIFFWIFQTAARGNTAKILSVILFVAWSTATAILTFHAPFTYTGNGFFGVWSAWVGSLLVMVSMLSGVDYIVTDNPHQTEADAVRSVEADASPMRTQSFV